MDALVNFINEPTGSTLGFIGIALIYFATVVFDTLNRRWEWFLKGAYICVGIVFVYLAYLCQQRGTVKTVDAGIVLAYLGIGAGLVCAASVSHSKRAIRNIIFGCIMTIGICFELFGLILVHRAGLI